MISRHVYLIIVLDISSDIRNKRCMHVQFFTKVFSMEDIYHAKYFRKFRRPANRNVKITNRNYA